MVIKGGSRRNIGFWSGHLEDTKKNDRAELIEKRGVLAEDLRGMMREMLENSELTRCKNFMYIASFNPTEGEVLTDEQWDRAYEIFEKERGIPEGQPRIVYEHEKKGRIHRHVVWDRVDQERQRAFPDGLDFKICEAAKHKIEAELELQKTPGLINRDPELPPAERRPQSWEMFRGMKSGVDPVDLKIELTAIFRESHSAADFAAGLEAHGYQLCIGDRRGFVILDSAGETHSLARRLDGVNTKQLNAFMEGFDRAALPSVDQAKAQHRDRKLAGLEAERAALAQEIEQEEKHLTFAEWVATLPEQPRPDGVTDQMEAAYQAQRGESFNEQEARQTLEQQRQPEDIFAGIGTPITEAETDRLRKQTRRDNEQEARQTLEQQRQPEDIFAGIGTPITEAERPAPQSTRGALAGGQQEKAPEPVNTQARQLHGTDAHIWEAMHQSDNAPAFIASLAERGLQFARVHADDRGPHKLAEDAREELARLNSMKANGVWLLATGGVSALTVKQLDSAHRSHDNYKHHYEQRDRHERPRPPLEFSEYVSFIQDKNAERVEHLKEQAAALGLPANDHAAAEKKQSAVTATVGTYVVINEHGHLYHINQRTTGLYPAQVQKFLAQMDAKPVQSVTAAREIVAERQKAQRRAAFAAERPERGPTIPRTQSKDTSRRVGIFVDRGIRQGLSIISRGFDFAAKALESILAPPTPKTPAVIEEEHRLAEHAAGQSERAAAKAAKVAYDDEHASTTARQQDETGRAALAAEQYERLQRDRDRGRERDR